MKIKIFLIIFIFIFTQKIYADQVFNEQSFDISDFLDQDFLDLDDQNIDQLDQKDIKEDTKDPKTEEIKEESTKVYQNFKEHIKIYYPKVFLISEKFFLFMTPEDMALSLQELVDMIIQKPYLYFEILFKKIEKKLTEEEKKEWKKKGFDLEPLKNIFGEKSLKKWIKNGGAYWELIVDQMSFYNDFIEFARVNKNNEIYLEKPNYYNFSSSNNKDKKLKDYWKEKGITVHKDFAALLFYYVARLFLECILNKDYNRVHAYYFDLKTIMDKLAGTDYESDYKETFKTYQDLFNILKKEQKKEFAHSNANAIKNDEDKWWQEMEDFLDD